MRYHQLELGKLMAQVEALQKQFFLVSRFYKNSIEGGFFQPAPKRCL